MRKLHYLVAALLPLTTLAAFTPAERPYTYGFYDTLLLPQNYRENTFLTSGIDMVYGPKGAPLHSITHGRQQSRFDNVFVNPESYQAFLRTGTWPDKTLLILEIRTAETNASINRSGHSQSHEVLGIEVHLKDTSRFPDGGWAFYDVDDTLTGTLIPRPAACYTCHQQHAAVDTTFVQFYPTLAPVAEAHKTYAPK